MAIKGSYKADTGILEKVFTQENYEHIKSQIGESAWVIHKIDKLKSVKVLPALDSKVPALRRDYLTLSKPVFTKDKKYALINYTYRGMFGLYIFEFKNNEWEEVKLIPVGIS